MPLISMTGFARAEGTFAEQTWYWEIRGVNARGLDVRLRLPAGLERLEPRLRETVGAHVRRGNVGISLNASRIDRAPRLRVNAEALAVVTEAARQLQEEAGAVPPSADGLLALRGVLEYADCEVSSEVSDEASDSALLDSFGKAINAFAGARAAEGSRLAAAMAAHIDEIERLHGEIAGSPARTPQAIGDRLRQQIARLVDTDCDFDPARLHQEAVILATRADVEEELNRLEAHVAAARELLGGGDQAGKRLSHLAQEFNREANTICSKSNDVAITQAGLAMKVAIEQLREQAQNVE